MKLAIEFHPEGGDDWNLVVDEIEVWYNDSEAAFETIDGISYNNVKVTIEKNNSDETISLTKGEAELRKNIDLSDIAEEGGYPSSVGNLLTSPRLPHDSYRRQNWDEQPV